MYLTLPFWRQIWSLAADLVKRSFAHKNIQVCRDFCPIVDGFVVRAATTYEFLSDPALSSKAHFLRTNPICRHYLIISK